MNPINTDIIDTHIQAIPKPRIGEQPLLKGDHVVLQVSKNGSHTLIKIKGNLFQRLRKMVSLKLQRGSKNVVMNGNIAKYIQKPTEVVLKDYRALLADIKGRKQLNSVDVSNIRLQMFDKVEERVKTIGSVLHQGKIGAEAKELKALRAEIKQYLNIFNHVNAFERHKDGNNACQLLIALKDIDMPQLEGKEKDAFKALETACLGTSDHRSLVPYSIHLPVIGVMLEHRESVVEAKKLVDAFAKFKTPNPQIPDQVSFYLEKGVAAKEAIEALPQEVRGAFPTLFTAIDKKTSGFTEKALELIKKIPVEFKAIVDQPYLLSHEYSRIYPAFVKLKEVLDQVGWKPEDREVVEKAMKLFEDRLMILQDKVLEKAQEYLPKEKKRLAKEVEPRREALNQKREEYQKFTRGAADFAILQLSFLTFFKDSFPVIMNRHDKRLLGAVKALVTDQGDAAKALNEVGISFEPGEPSLDILYRMPLDGLYQAAKKGNWKCTNDLEAILLQRNTYRKEAQSAEFATALKPIIEHLEKEVTTLEKKQQKNEEALAILEKGKETFLETRELHAVVMPSSNRFRSF